MPAKVCLMIGQLGLGGTEKQVVLLARGLRDRGIDACVLTMFGGGPREQALLDAGVPLRRLGFSGSVWGRESPGTPPPLPGWSGSCASSSRTCCTPSFCTATSRPHRRRGWRGSRCWWPPRSLGDLSRTAGSCCASRAWLPGRPICSSRMPMLSPTTPGNGSGSTEKISVVYNGLPDDDFTAHPPAQVETGYPLLLCVANLKACKGHQYLLEATARLRANGLHPGPGG